MKAALSAAMSFVCPECGAKCYVDPVDVSREASREMFLSGGGELQSDQEVIVWPGRVLCPACDTGWETELAEG